MSKITDFFKPANATDCSEKNERTLGLAGQEMETTNPLGSPLQEITNDKPKPAGSNTFTKMMSAEALRSNLNKKEKGKMSVPSKSSPFTKEKMSLPLESSHLEKGMEASVLPLASLHLKNLEKKMEAKSLKSVPALPLALVHHEKKNKTAKPLKSASVEITDVPGFPVSKIKAIMKSVPCVDIATSESVHMISKATELFVKNLAQRTMECAKNPKNIDYDDVSTVVHSDPNLSFLKKAIPKKISWTECQKLMKKKEKELELKMELEGFDSK